MVQDARDELTGRLNRRYLIAFGLIAALLLLDHALVEPPLLRLAVDAPTINVAGRQRMLSQRLAKAALAAALAERADGRAARLAELDSARRAWSESHARLRAGLGPGAVRSAFVEVEGPFRQLHAASGRVAAAYDGPRSDEAEARRALADVLAAEPEYLGRMERVVGLYEREASRRVVRLLWTGRAATAASLLTLGGVGLLVLRPALRLIRAQIHELDRSRTGLEATVRERTHALEREAAERSRAEARHRATLEAFSHAARTNTLGEMASGLAHELNQPLGAIANYAEGCLVELGRDRPDLVAVSAAIGKVSAAAIRAGEVIKRIRRFVTRHAPIHERFDPNRAAEEVAELLREEAEQRSIRLQTHLAPDLPWVMGDFVQIQQVLVNLVRNAFDAVEAAETSGKTVVVASRTGPVGGPILEVSDDGEGIAADRIDRVFDAYFSSRADGMGMGLAISRTITESHGGTLTVESEPGVGSTFRLMLPPDGAGDDAGTHGLRR